MSKMIKGTVCLVACVMLLMGNSINTDAGWWDCLWGNHNIQCYRVAATCCTYGYYESRCADCDKFFWRETNWDAGLGSHCYTTNRYQVPTCIYCGRRR